MQRRRQLHEPLLVNLMFIGPRVRSRPRFIRARAPRAPPRVSLTVPDEAQSAIPDQKDAVYPTIKRQPDRDKTGRFLRSGWARIVLETGRG